MQSWVLKLVDIEHSPNREVALLSFELTHGEIDFEEGQFVMLETIDYKIDDKPLKKPYSIASTHNHFLDTKQLQFYIKQASPTGMSHFLTQEIKLWDMLRFQWPAGHFVDDKAFDKYLFVSMGSGVGGIYAHYLESISQEVPASKVLNIFWEKTTNDLIPRVTKNFSLNNANCKNILFLSREETVQEPFRKGHVQDAISEALEFLQDSNFVAFLCGKPQMVLDVKKVLEQAGIPESQIKVESY